MGGASGGGGVWHTPVRPPFPPSAGEQAGHLILLFAFLALAISPACLASCVRSGERAARARRGFSRDPPTLTRCVYVSAYAVSGIDERETILRGEIRDGAVRLSASRSVSQFASLLRVRELVTRVVVSRECVRWRACV